MGYDMFYGLESVWQHYGLLIVTDRRTVCPFSDEFYGVIVVDREK